jgi:pectinesterase
MQNGNAMMKRKIVLYLLLCSSLLLAKEKADIIVAQDGTGTFTTIQEAINSVPDNNARNVIILIKNGTYHEKLYITKSFISLVGESRDSTRIVYAELRKNWVKAHNTDWGSATVNIDSTVTDLTFANLTMYNNYGSLYGSHDHQFAVWGTGTRIIMIECNIIADGGDTLSLWNKTNGMYFHANCYFEGWVDYVCPRGWCYITDSRFYGHNLSASLWHDGDVDKDQKFVLRYSYFDGVPGFPLGRHHRDGQFYLLDCIFSKNMADEQIIFPSYSPNAKPWKWGARHYYYNCHREGGDEAWFSDNLSTAPGSPSPEEVNAQWTFAGKWNPEREMPPVLSYVSLPSPRNNSYIKAKNVDLSWVSSRNADGALLYLGTSRDSLHCVQSGKITAYRVENILPGVRYFWQVRETVGKDTLSGVVFHFTAESTSKP